MIVVSDTTATSSLYRIGKLELFQTLFHSIILPNAIFEELLELEKFGYDISTIKNADWIQVKHATNQQLIFNLSETLDLRESESIALAQEIGADLLLIDEKRGRLKANELGIATVGLIGIITRLKKAGDIEAVKPLLDELRNTGFWIQESFYQKIVASKAANAVCRCCFISSFGRFASAARCANKEASSHFPSPCKIPIWAMRLLSKKAFSLPFKLV